ncbi:pilus (MSHA type) biogenesis protein MshL [Helicobacter sp. MIT 05-5294]|uniref:pilus (MSHA type) biogenesis protein MshL n=1 Tax=Helicobacter sp. MIT 05-5294 TaxID=1548150 RepID=UPI00051FA9EF|nr:pilus (MSHA type) biogenesis protein MshL [Helicobacter sp. MIT 05-5294]TLD85955.1 pilus (MSHA type) biogenesis protein MshL [Helicobacter sp. MIT 05-5294]
MVLIRFCVVGLLLFVPLFACQNRLFNLTLQGYPIKVSEVLNEFANECHFSVVWDESEVESRLAQSLSMVNFKDKDLDFVFELLFNTANLHYSFDKDILKLKTNDIKTFKINYLSTNRQGVSNTSVSINNEERQNYYTTQSQEENLSKSGINIKSEDGFNFWETIESEILTLINAKAEDGRVIINRGAGLVSVKGDRMALQRVESYIQNLHERLQQQVLIDVHILSVSHKNTQTMGINWESLYDLQNLVIPPFSESASLGGKGEMGNVSGLNLIGGDGGRSLHYGVNIFSQGVSLTRIVEFLKTYGVVQSISNPKVLTLNNQPAMISVGDILRYKKSNIYQNTNAQTTLTNTDNEYPSIFAGVLLDITPLVFGEEIMLKINPSITKTKDNKSEIPSNAFDTPPNLTTNQLSSIVKVKNNQKIVLGGLISQNTINQQSKVPLLGDIPLLKFLFSYQQEVQNTEEIIFIIEPKIIAENELTLESLGYRLIDEDIRK